MHRGVANVKRTALADIPEIIEILCRCRDRGLAEKEQGRLCYGYNCMLLNERHATVTLAELIANDPRGACFHTEHAVFAGYIRPCLYNFANNIASELFWQSDGRDGVMVLRAFEEWASGMAASHIYLSCLKGSTRDEAAQFKFMQRRGYRMVSTDWRKDLA